MLSKLNPGLLKVMILIIAIPLLAICVYGLSRFNPDSPYWSSPELAQLQYPVLTGMYMGMIPFFFALYQALKFLGYMSRDEASSEKAIKAVGKIKYCAVAIGIVYVLELPFLYRLMAVDDAPAILIGAFIIAGSAMVFIFSAALQRNLKYPEV
ncbi:DUF2975 domain-containing protein [Salinicoccus cyprini]|uniref:DUF2975 domain-containing protein n=2 Tax=Salinicoccus cyprini TaxID=2493691 RepID=A0A558AVN5_9STAP|nr:DUF2975 domain-containing protein [Salinicoccus cyprini]